MDTPKMISQARGVQQADERAAAMYALVFLLGVSALGGALNLPPTDGDDLSLLSSVAAEKSPIRYLYGDWGLGNNGYRPLHSLTLWCSYRLFGVSAGYHQLINLLLHCAVVSLLLRQIRRVRPDDVLSFLLASLSLVSIYTVSAATWVSDRPTLFVALCFLLLVDHLYGDDRTRPPRLPYVAFLSVLALMGKESGLLVPLLAFYSAFEAGRPREQRVRLAALALSTIAGYAAFRLALFGSQATAYAESGFLLGVAHYADSARLPGYLRAFAYCENVAKNVIAPFAPVFTDEGGIPSAGALVGASLIGLATILLVGLHVRRGTTVLQRMALFVIVINALVHYSVFRHRVQYLSQLAICLFVASSPLLERGRARRLLTEAAAVLLLFFGVLSTNRSLGGALVSRYSLIRQQELRPVVEEWSPRIDEEIRLQVLERYKR